LLIRIVGNLSQPIVVDWSIRDRKNQIGAFTIFICML
jgi:hypothetical protein